MNIIIESTRNAPTQNNVQCSGATADYVWRAVADANYVNYLVSAEMLRRWSGRVGPHISSKFSFLNSKFDLSSCLFQMRCEKLTERSIDRSSKQELKDFTRGVRMAVERIICGTDFEPYMIWAPVSRANMPAVLSDYKDIHSVGIPNNPMDKLISLMMECESIPELLHSMFSSCRDTIPTAYTRELAERPLLNDYNAKQDIVFRVIMYMVYTPGRLDLLEMFVHKFSVSILAANNELFVQVLTRIGISVAMNYRLMAKVYECFQRTDRFYAKYLAAVLTVVQRTGSPQTMLRNVARVLCYLEDKLNIPYNQQAKHAITAHLMIHAATGCDTYAADAARDTGDNIRNAGDNIRNAGDIAAIMTPSMIALLKSKGILNISSRMKYIGYLD